MVSHLIAYNDLFMGLILWVFFALTFPVGKRLGMGKFVSNITFGSKIPLWVPRFVLLAMGLLCTAMGAVELIKR